MLRWLEAVKLASEVAPNAASQIVQVAQSVAALYLQQWKYLQPQEGSA